MKHITLAIMLTGLLTLFTSVTVGETELTQFETVGVLNSTDFATRTLRIDGRQFQMAEDIEWVGLKEGEIPSKVVPRLIRKQVGYIADTDASGPPIVTAVWFSERGTN